MQLEDQAYCQSMHAKLNSVVSILQRAEAQLATQALDEWQYLACERSMQILIDAAIGIAKRAVVQLGFATPATANKAFEMLDGQGVDMTALDWKAVIGMRNALVHNYLEFDRDRLLTVIREGKYRQIEAFCRALIQSRHQS